MAAFPRRPRSFGEQRDHREENRSSALHPQRMMQAVRLGLIATELVINALKLAFPDRSTGRITVNYIASGGSWGLSVPDAGVGLSPQPNVHPSAGLGTGIVEALARQLSGWVEVTTGSHGTPVSVLSNASRSRS